MAELPLFIVSFMYAFLATEALYPNGTCDRDSDCLDPVGYHCCKGTTWCCPDEYICTATKTCISNIGLGLQVGKIVGICFGLLFAVSGGSCCYYLKKKSKGNTSVHQPPAGLFAQPPAQPPAEPLAELSVQPLAKFSAQPPTEFPPKYRRL